MELYAKPKIGKLETHKPDTLVECARVGKQEIYPFFCFVHPTCSKNTLPREIELLCNSAPRKRGISLGQNWSNTPVTSCVSRRTSPCEVCNGVSSDNEILFVRSANCKTSIF